MFCMRSVRDAYPEDPNGIRFSPSCEGEAVPADIRNDPRAVRLVSLLDRRATAIAALDQVLGETTVTNSKAFAKDELKEFTWKLLPFYSDNADDATLSKILPRSTQALGRVMARLADKDDPDATAVRETISRLAAHVGYRTPERVLAVIRPSLTYDRLDELVDALLDLVAAGGSGHDVFMEMLQGTALELAEPAEAKQDPSTLSLALQLLMNPDALYATAEQQQTGRTLAALPVLQRDPATGDAIAVGGSSDTPFPVAGRSDAADRASGTLLALASANEPAYQTFDANQTALASLMRDSIPLVRRDGKERSTVENTLRSSRALLGKTVTRTEKFGAKTLTYDGPDIENGPMANFLWSITSLLKLPETKQMLQVINALIVKDESAATQLINAIYNIDAKTDDPAFAGKLNGTNEFWDDLIQIGRRIVTDPAKNGLLLDILKATTTPQTVATGVILGHQMANKDVAKLATESNVNSDVTTACPKADGQATAPGYCVPVERMSGGDVGMNRSIFQRTLNIVHGTYASPNCNKDGATLTVQQPLETTFPNPPLGPLAPFLQVFGSGSGSCPTSMVAPPPATSYQKCTLIEQKSGAVTLIRAMLDKSTINIKDPEVAQCATAVGQDIDVAQEREAGITGFTTKPTVKALNRFIYAPRNKFLTDMFDPYPTIDGVPLVDYEPYGVYLLEVLDPAALVDGQPQSFITAARPLLEAFDSKETFNANGDSTTGYLFAELLDVLHMHYDSPHTELCPDKATQGQEGCSQSADPTKKFYAYGTNAVSYEPLLSWALLDQNLLGVLNTSTTAIAGIDIQLDDGSTKNGLNVLNDFLTALLKGNADMAYKDGHKFSKTNSCTGPDKADPTKCDCGTGEPTDDGLWCKAGDTYRRRGRILEGGVPPLYLMLDALNDIDTTWTTDAERHGIYLNVRSTLVDQLLKVEQAADKTTKFKNRRVYALTQKAIPWLLARLDAHKGDLNTWADGLVNRLAGVLAHPIAARGMDLFDKFWESKAAGDEVAALIQYLLDEDANPDLFQNLLVSASDTLNFFDKDPDYTPAVRFVSLALSEGSLDAVNNGGDTPNVDEGTAYRFLEVTRSVSNVDQGPELSTLGKVLRNSVLPMTGDLDGKSPLEVVIDLVADVNRDDPTQDTVATLTPDDNARVYDQINQFLTDPGIGLERLYQVIDNRELP